MVDDSAGSRGPLAGVKVLDFSQAWAGPLCTRTLGDLGADVLKVESDAFMDVSRTLGPYPASPDRDSSGYFLEWNRAKRSVSLDLRTDEGRASAQRLASLCDVVVENFSPGVMERLGLGYDVLHEANQQLVMVSISGFGRTGPAREHVAFGQQIEAVSGLMSLMTYDDGRPTKTGISWSDPLAGFLAAFSVLAALEQRDRSGKGEWLEVSMLEATLATMGRAFALMNVDRSPADEFRGGRHPELCPAGVYPTHGEDAWIAIECRDQAEWESLCRVAGVDWADRSEFSGPTERLRNRDELDSLMASLTTNLDAQVLADELQREGVPASPLVSIADLLGDEHLADRGFWVTVDHPTVGKLVTAGTALPIAPATLASMPAPPILGSTPFEAEWP